MFQRHIHSFRAIAITAVVAQHCTNSVVWDQGSSVHSVLAAGIFGASIWFTFISGFLFQYLSPRFTTAKYLKAKLRNVIAPYLIMSIPALVISAFVIHQDSVPPSFYDLPGWQRIALFVLTGKHLAPFWYIPVIAIFYLGGALFVRMDRAKWPCLLLIPLAIASATLGRDGFQGLLQRQMGDDVLWAPVGHAAYLLAPYLFGMFCSRYQDRILNMTAEEINLLLAIALIAFAINVHYFHGEESDAALFVFKMATCPLLLWGTYRLSDAISDRMATIADYSFGIYFVHGYILAAVNMIAPYTILGTVLAYGGMAAWLVLLASVLMACTFIITSSKRYLLGTSSRLVMGC
jgi:peptidoglycan/LPS O-acetylase OafA/YrhL